MAEERCLGIDYGEKRSGIAVASLDGSHIQPLTTLQTEEGDLADLLKPYIDEHHITTLVMGLPRGLDGQETRQTGLVRQVAQRLEVDTGLPVVLQDEAVTSELARERLEVRGESLADGAIDREAAVIILEDYLRGRDEATI